MLIGLKISQRPADQDHPYGHWKAEPVASLVAAFIMVAVGLQVLYTAALSVFDRTTVAPDPIAACTGFFVWLSCMGYTGTTGDWHKKSGASL